MQSDMQYRGVFGSVVLQISFGEALSTIATIHWVG